MTSRLREWFVILFLAVTIVYFGIAAYGRARPELTVSRNGLWIELGVSGYVHLQWRDYQSDDIQPRVHCGRWATFRRELK